MIDIISAWERVLSLPVCSSLPFYDNPLTAGQTLLHPERLSETTSQATVFARVSQRKRKC